MFQIENGNHKSHSIEISKPPKGLEHKYNEIFTNGAVEFLVDLVSTFSYRVNSILRTRKLTKLMYDELNQLPDFNSSPINNISSKGYNSAVISAAQLDWKISPLQQRLQNRHVDLGDVSPANPEHLKGALLSPVQGIQVDYDDGNCPSWKNMLEGIHNVISITRGQFFPNEIKTSLASLPLLILRPRAWNMNEHNVIINGKEIPGPLMDFGLLIYHTGHAFAKASSGPFYYLSKMESALEARLWNDIFIWSQAKLGIPRGTIKACVLVESILATFEMEHILYELREHSLGLNCGIWDYCASIVNKFGDRKQFLLPDRNKYVSMDKPFLTKYMKLVIQTCHKRGAPATGGMAALTLNSLIGDDKTKKIEAVCKAKLREIHCGVDGFMVYDTGIVPWVNELWQRFGSNFGPNQINSVLHSNFSVTANELLSIAEGGITTAGLLNNIKVGIVYIYSWIAEAKGHFILDGLVEDSATAEISRSQIWQWILHRTHLEDGTREQITKNLVSRLAWNFYHEHTRKTEYNGQLLESSTLIFLELISAFEPPEFITTFLYNHTAFRTAQQT